MDEEGGPSSNPESDEYRVFKGTLEALEQGNQEWYTALTKDLSEQDRKAIGEVITLCQQRTAMKESQSIEQAGGEGNNTGCLLESKFSTGWLVKSVKAAENGYEEKPEFRAGWR